MHALARRNPSQTDTAQFRRWFGASKVVDEQGQPLVVYHGTTAGGFDAFRPNYRKGEQLGFGIHFAQDRGFAAKYAEDPTVARKGKTPKVYGVYLSIQRPLVSDAIVYEGTPEFALAKKLAGSKLFFQRNEDGVLAAYMQNAIDQTTAQRAEKLIREAGYDGIVYEAQLSTSAWTGTGLSLARVASSRSFIVFDPTQVKSATDNAGTFDPADANIYRNPRRRGLDVRPGIEGTYLTRYTAKGGGKRAYPTQGGAAWDRTLVRVANETTAPSGRVYDTVKRAERAGHATVRGKRGAVEVLRVTNPSPDALIVGISPTWAAADTRRYNKLAKEWAERTEEAKVFGASRNLQYLGSGDHRAVFRDGLHPRRVLKLNYDDDTEVEDEYLLPETLTEVRVWETAPAWARSHLVPLLGHDPRGRWAVFEYATPRETPMSEDNLWEREAAAHRRGEPPEQPPEWVGVAPAVAKRLAACGLYDVNAHNLSKDGRVLDYGKVDLELWESCSRKENPRRRNPDAEPLVFYHGAQRWEGTPSIVAHRKGHAEHGAGIYLTTSWTTASNYAKGGGSVYRFEVSPDLGWLEDARLPVAETVRWVKSLPRLKGKADIVATLERVAGRVGPSIPAETLVVAFVNFGASAGQHGPSLAEYLVAHGIDVSHVSRSGEDWVVVFNPTKVLRVTRVPARDMGEGFVYDLPRVTRKNPSRHTSSRRNPRAACPTKLMKYEYLGTTDEVTTCDCCGKTNLKNTVAIRDLDEGEVLHFGVTCAARALKVQVADVKKGAADADRQRREEEFRRRDAENRANTALWHEWLIERTGGIYEYDRSPDVFRMIQALGGMAAARVGFEEWKAAKKARSNPRRGGRR